VIFADSVAHEGHPSAVLFAMPHRTVGAQAAG
jgi:hypothetical protein